MQLEDMSTAELIALVKRQEQELAAIPAQTGIPVTPKAIEEIKDLLLWPVTEDDARAARDMMQSIHFDLSMADTVAIPMVEFKDAQPVQQPAPVAAALTYLCDWLDKLPRRQIKDSQTHSYIAADNVEALVEQARAALAAPVAAPVAGQEPYGWLTGNSSNHRQGTLQDVTSNYDFALEECAEYNRDADDPDHVDRVPVPLYTAPVPAASVAQPVSDAPTEPHKTVLYVEDLIEILSENRTVTSAGYMGTCERVVDHRGLLELLHRALDAAKKVA